MSGTARILVTYGSKHGGTKEIAAAIADTLRTEGFTVDLEPARDVTNIASYDAVIVGGALYAGLWHRDARRFVHRNKAALRERAVYMFSSGPLDASADEKSLPPVRGVATLMKAAGARKHVTFGGRLERDVQGFLASRIAKQHSGDWRSWHLIRAWARLVGEELREEPKRVIMMKQPKEPTRWLLAALCYFVAITAIGGGISLLLRPDGSVLELPRATLAHSPFSSFFVPGFLLFTVIGLGSLAAAALVTKNSRIANHAAFGAGTALLVWIVTEMGLLRSIHWLQVSYFAVATLIMLEAYRRWLASQWRVH